MSIESQQQEWMRNHHKWKEKERELEEKIREANAKGQDGEEIYGYQLRKAIHQANLCYELATDRGF